MSKRKKLLYDTEQVILCRWASVSFSVKWGQESVDRPCVCSYLSEPGFVATASSQGVTSLATADFSVDGGLAGASDSRHPGLAQMSPQLTLAPASPHKGPLSGAWGHSGCSTLSLRPQHPQSPLASSPKVRTRTHRLPGGPSCHSLGALPCSPRSPRTPLQARPQRQTTLLSPGFWTDPGTVSSLFFSCVTSDPAGPPFFSKLFSPSLAAPFLAPLQRHRPAAPVPAVPSSVAHFCPAVPEEARQAVLWPGRWAVQLLATCGPSANSFFL